MEYLLSNLQLAGTKKFGRIFYSGSAILDKESLVVMEGFFIEYDRKKALKIEPSKIIQRDFLGIYNYLWYDKSSAILQLKNDKHGMMGLYIYQDSGNFIISNNIWHIIRSLQPENIQFDNLYLKNFLLNFGTLDSQTFFKNIKFLPPASIAIVDINKKNISIRKYWDFKHTPDPKLTIKEAVEQFDSDLTKQFKIYSERNKGKIFAFGNSGGLDSRLIPVYAKPSGMELIGYTIGDIKPNKFCYSITHKNASKIADIFEFENTNIDYRHSDPETSMLLDIRNNIMGPNQLFKNHYDKVPEFDILLGGGNGYIVGGNWAEFADLKSKDQIINYLLNHSSKHHLYFKNNKITNAINFILRNRFYSPNKGGLIELNESPLNSLLSDRERKDINEIHIEFIEKNLHKDNLSLLRSYKQYVTNKPSFHGGFESINRTTQTLYLYYPLPFEGTLLWQDNFFFERKALKELITLKNRRLANIPDQQMQKIDSGRNNILINTLKAMEFELRSWGLDYRTWIKHPKWQDFSKKILYRKNPVFEELLSIKKLKELDITTTHPQIGMDFIKIKKIMDIIYYREFDFINVPEFMIQ